MSLVLCLLTEEYISVKDDVIKQKFGTLDYICDVISVQNLHLYYVDLLIMEYGLSYGNCIKKYSLDFLEYHFSDIFDQNNNVPKTCYFDFLEQFEDMYKIADGICFWYKYINDNIKKLGKIGLWITWDHNISNIIETIKHVEIIRKSYYTITPNDLVSLDIDKILMIEG